MKWMVILIAGVVAIIATGVLLPIKHRVSESAHFNVSAETLWARVTNFGAYPQWRSGVSAVERLANANGNPVWKEIDAHGDAISYETIDSVPSRRLVRRIADPNLPFGGTWEFTFEPTPDGVMLTITENGEVYNPVFRFVSKFIVGHDKNIHGYLSDLRGRD